MTRRISNNTKRNRALGTGEGKNYQPWITTSEFNSLGTTSVIKDWKTGRGVHCLSQGEAMWFYILRWDDENIDIREQLPLDMEKVIQIADAFGFRSPKADQVMTTDFVATKADGRLHAYSVKANRDLSERTLQLLMIEKQYWNLAGVEYTLLFKTDANRILVSNIRLVTEFYDTNNVFDEYSALKNKIANKEIQIDMSKELITTDVLGRLTEEYV